MLKSELITRLAQKMSHVPVRTINHGVNHLIQLMSNALADNQRIEVRGFGSFSTKQCQARNAHNPKTGEKLTTTEKFSPKFKPGKELRDLVNGARDSRPPQEEK